MNPIPPLADAELGFDTQLIEAIAATIILALLMALALFNYRPYLDKARIAEGYVLAREFQIDAELFYAHHGIWSSDTVNDEVGHDVQATQLENGVITLRYQPTRGLSITDALSFRPTVKTNVEFPATVFWSCGYAPPKAGFTIHGENRTTISPDYLTAVCR